MTEAIMPMKYANRPAIFLLAAAVLFVVEPVSAKTEASTYAIVIANNQSLDPETAPLRFADDDAAGYYEMLKASGAKVELLAVLDPDAQARFAEAADAATPPSRKALDKALARVFSKIEEDAAERKTTHFMFIYSGHGDVGANREGYINLLDAKFHRSELFREVIAKSPATFNHIILDACHAYYMVNKRGGADKTGDYSEQVRSFLSAEELFRYPNTGFILAASGESETHEWSKWEGGLFSHELTSALLGTADVNQDGLVTYDEAASCVEAANSSVDVPKARLKVFYQPPAADVDVPLMRLASFKTVRKLTVPAAMAGKYYIEDSRGIRIADFNFSGEQPVRIALPGKAPFFLRTEKKEADIKAKGRALEILASNLTFRETSSSSRGGVEQSFRRNLYKTPFGTGFYKGMTAVRQAETPEPLLHSPAPVDLKSPSRAKIATGWSLLGAGIAVGFAGGMTYYAADRAFDDYKSAEKETDARNYQESAENRLLASRILIGAGAAAAAVGTVFLITEAVSKKTREKRRVRAAAAQLEGGLYIGVSGNF